jgi:uncharacterized protein YjbI with pentapeptide repeats
VCCCTKSDMHFPLSEPLRGTGGLAVKHASHIWNKSLDSGVSRSSSVTSAPCFTNIDCDRAQVYKEAARVQFSSVQFYSVQFSSIQFSSVQFSSIQFSLVLFNSVQFSSV